MRRTVKKAIRLILLIVLLCLAIAQRQWIVSKVETFASKLYTIGGERDANGDLIVAEETAKQLHGFAYEQLTAEQQGVYGQILNGLNNYKETFYVTSTIVEDVQESFYGVLCDHPELFWVDASASFTTDSISEYCKVETSFNTPVADIPSVQERINVEASTFFDTIAGAGSTYEKVKAAYEYVILNTDYLLDSEQNQNIQSVFLNHQSVCAGYAKAFQYLLQQMDIPCYYIEGTVLNSESGAVEDHAWNCVNIDGTFCMVDVTWGDPTYESEDDLQGESISYDYLNITTEEITRTHTPTGTYKIPVCESHTYDYYVQENRYLTGFAESTISDILQNDVNNTVPITEIKFSDYDNYKSAIQAIFQENGLIESPARQKMEWDGITNYQYSYICNDSLYILKIKW